MNKKILILGTATIDLIFRGSIFDSRKDKGRLSLADGGKYVVEDMYEFCGGGGANVSVSLSKQGLEPSLFARIANDNYGVKILKNLTDNKVSPELLDRSLERTPVSVVLLDTRGKRTIVTYRSESDQLPVDSFMKINLAGFGWLALFSLPKLVPEIKLKMLREAKRHGLKIFLSLHGDEYKQGLANLTGYFSVTDLLDLNVYELSDLLGRPYESIELKSENIAAALNLPRVIVTCDKNGSYYYDKDIILYQDPLEVNRVDTTGAGDAFCAGFLGKFLKTGDVKLSMAYAAQNAKAEIEQLGAQTGLLSDTI